MKNKILSFVLAICLIIPCALMFAGCNDKEPKDNAIYVDSATELATAIADAKAEDVIKLNANIDLTNTITITNTVTINLNGKTLTQTNTEDDYSMFIIDAEGILTIEGEGIVNSATQANDYSMAVWAKNGGKAIINGGTFTNVGAKDFEDDDTTPNNNELIYASANGEIIINGGAFIGNTENERWGTRYTLNKKDGSNGQIIVKGGTFKEFNPAESLSENPQANFVADGYTVGSTEVEGATWYTVVAE